MAVMCILKKGQARLVHFMRKLLFFVILAQCFFVSGFYFQRGNQNVEYDDSALSPQVLLTFLGVQYPFENKASIERILNEYSKSHPNILISYEGVPLRTYPYVLKQRVKTDSVDDVFMVPPAYARRDMPEGLLADLSGLPALSVYRQEILAQMRMGSAVPYVVNSLGAFGLFCNLDMLERNKLGVPQTLDDFLAACEAFRRAGVTPLAVDRESLRALLIARCFEPAAFGDAEGFFRSLDTDAAFLGQTLLDGFRFLALLRDKGYFDAASLARPRESMPDMIFSGDGQPFMIGGSWLSPVMGRAQTGFRFSVFPLPVAGRGAVVLLGLDTPLAVSSQSRHKQQAIQLVEGLTNPEVIRLYSDGQGCFSPLKDAPLPADKAVHPLWRGMETGRVVFHSDVRLRYDLWERLKPGIELILSGASAEEAAESVVHSPHVGREERSRP